MALAQRSDSDSRALREYVSEFSDLLDAWRALSVAPIEPESPPSTVRRKRPRSRKKAVST